MHTSLKQAEHRPWPLPAGPWVMAQKWHDLLFAHWPVPEGVLRERIPRELELDRFAGQFWLGIVPFRMSGVRLRATPAMPGLSAFPELNVRTYVTAGGKPGVWFFSLDAANRIAVEVARRWFHLPYFMGRMKCREKDGGFLYASVRTDGRGDGESFAASYTPLRQTFQAQKGTLEHFLTERYCLYAQRNDGAILRSEIHHAQWQLQSARADISLNTMVNRIGVALEGKPALLHFSRLQDVIVWRPKIVEGFRPKQKQPESKSPAL